MDDIDAMFSDLLGEMDLLTQVSSAVVMTTTKHGYHTASLQDFTDIEHSSGLFTLTSHRWVVVNVLRD